MLKFILWYFKYWLNINKEDFSNRIEALKNYIFDTGFIINITILIFLTFWIIFLPQLTFIFIFLILIFLIDLFLWRFTYLMNNTSLKDEIIWKIKWKGIEFIDEQFNTDKIEKADELVWDYLWEKLDKKIKNKWLINKTITLYIDIHDKIAKYIIHWIVFIIFKNIVPNTDFNNYFLKILYFPYLLLIKIPVEFTISLLISIIKYIFNKIWSILVFMFLTVITLWLYLVYLVLYKYIKRIINFFRIIILNIILFFKLLIKYFYIWIFLGLLYLSIHYNIIWLLYIEIWVIILSVLLILQSILSNFIWISIFKATFHYVISVLLAYINPVLATSYIAILSASENKESSDMILNFIKWNYHTNFFKKINSNSSKVNVWEIKIYNFWFLEKKLTEQEEKIIDKENKINKVDSFNKWESISNLYSSYNSYNNNNTETNIELSEEEKEYLRKQQFELEKLKREKELESIKRKQEFDKNIKKIKEQIIYIFSLLFNKIKDFFIKYHSNKYFILMISILWVVIIGIFVFYSFFVEKVYFVWKDVKVDNNGIVYDINWNKKVFDGKVVYQKDWDNLLSYATIIDWYVHTQYINYPNWKPEQELYKTYDWNKDSKSEYIKTWYENWKMKLLIQNWKRTEWYENWNKSMEWEKYKWDIGSVMSAGELLGIYEIPNYNTSFINYNTPIEQMWDYNEWYENGLLKKEVIYNSGILIPNTIDYSYTDSGSLDKKVSFSWWINTEETYYPSEKLHTQVVSSLWVIEFQKEFYENWSLKNIIDNSWSWTTFYEDWNVQEHTESGTFLKVWYFQNWDMNYEYKWQIGKTYDEKKELVEECKEIYKEEEKTREVCGWFFTNICRDEKYIDKFTIVQCFDKNWKYLYDAPNESWKSISKKE